MNMILVLFYLFLAFVLYCAVLSPFLMVALRWVCKIRLPFFEAFRISLFSQSLFWLANAIVVSSLGPAQNRPVDWFRFFVFVLTLLSTSGLCYGLKKLSSETEPLGLLKGFAVASVQLVLFTLLVILPLIGLSILFAEV